MHWWQASKAEELRRGADSCFDLGHFLLHDRETRPAPLFGSFLEGYREVSTLTDDSLQAIRTSVPNARRSRPR
jgi:hypothetical protein